MEERKIGNYEVQFGTAKAVTIGDHTMQEAVRVHYLPDEFGNGDAIIFGVQHAEFETLDEDEITELLKDSASTDHADLATFVPLGGTIYIVSDMRGGDLFDTYFSDRNDALKAADDDWSHLTRDEQRRRESFFVCAAVTDVDEFGTISHEITEMIKVYKEGRS